MIALGLDGVSVRLGGVPVLERVSLAVAAGELIGLIGPNGAGKSTLLRAAAGLEPLAAGGVTLLGRPVAGLDRRERAKAMAYLPQHGPVHWPLPVRDLVALGRLPHRAAFAASGDDDAAAVARALERAGVAAFAARPIDTLSGGERGRALLARALAGEPALLLADEPTASLDLAHQLQIMELLAGLAAGGMAVIAVLHDLGLAARICPRLVLLDRGRIAADGPPAAVLTPERLAAVYGIDGALETVDGIPVLVARRRLGAA